MALNRISNGVPKQHQLIEAYQPPQEQARSAKSGSSKPDGTRQQTTAATDKAEISHQAREHVAHRRLVAAGRQEIERLPDVRQDRLALVRQRLASDFYKSLEVRGEVAGRLGKLFLEGDL